MSSTNDGGDGHDTLDVRDWIYTGGKVYLAVCCSPAEVQLFIDGFEQLGLVTAAEFVGAQIKGSLARRGVEIGDGKLPIS